MGEAESVARVILCSGKVYYDLIGYLESNQINDTALVRVEQLYPLELQGLEATIGSVRRAIQKTYPHYTSTQVHRLEVADIVVAIVVGVIAIGLWLWMARASAGGHNYARITGSVFFALNTLFLLIGLARPHVGLGLVFSVLVWLAGLGAVIMLWRRESGAYFTQPTQ